MSEPKNNSIRSGRIRQTSPRRISPDIAGSSGPNPARSGTAASAGCCRFLPDSTTATSSSTTTATIMMMITITGTSSTSSSSSGNGNCNDNVIVTRSVAANQRPT
jgi:hypothetical protein